MFHVMQPTLLPAFDQLMVVCLVGGLGFFPLMLVWYILNYSKIGN